MIPVYKNGLPVEVGHTIIKNNAPEEIVRVDSNTRQVWYKKGGFDWFEDMKNYQEV